MNDKQLRNFMMKFHRENGCWIWHGAASRGYGQVGGGDRKMRPAHRISYEHFTGPIPAGLHLDHLCRNRACVNPEHCEPVTCRENVRRGEGIAAKHMAKTHCIQGHELSVSNLYRTRKGHRVCRTCALAANRKHSAKKKAQHT